MPSLTKVQSGFVEAQGALPLSSGTAAAPGLKFDDHAGTGMFSPSTGAIGFSTSGHPQAVTFKTDGKVGIGAANNTSYDTNAQNLLLASDGNTGMTIRSAGSTPFAMIHFADGTSGQAQQRAGRIMYQHQGDNLTLHTANQERLRIDGDGRLIAGGADTTLAHTNADDLIIGNTSSGTRTGITLVSADNQDAGLYFSDGTSTNNANIQGQIVYNHNDTTLKFYTGAASAITIKEHGHTDFTGYADFIRPAGDAYSYAGFGPGGTSAKAAFIRRGSEIDLEMWSNYTGSPTISINSAGSISASSVNLQSSSTSSWFQTGTSIASYDYVWAAKNSSSNTWHSGLQTDGDLYLGGNLASSNNIGLSGSTGSAFFASQALNITTAGNIVIANPTTSAKLNILGDISGNYTGWKERNVASGSMSAASIASKTPTINDFTYPNNSNGMLIWSTSKIGFAAGAESPQYGSGVQMLFDSAGLILGNNRAFDRTTNSTTTTDWTVKLRTNGIGQFKNSLYANPLQLSSSDSYIKSGYGAISNSYVQSLNNLMIASNIRGYLQGIDGGSVNNNYYSVVTHGSMGYAGTEYCYGGITKFYNGTGSSMGGATSANTAFTPSNSMYINGSGIVTKPNNPSFQVSRNQSNWTVAGGGTKFDWDLVEHNTGSHFSTSTDQFTAPVSGTYQFNFSIIWYNNILNNEWVSFRKNANRITGGDIHFSADFSGNKWHHISYSLSVFLSTGDYVAMYNGGNSLGYHGTTWGQWSGYLVG